MDIITYIDSLIKSYPLMSYFISIILGLLFIAKLIKNDNNALNSKGFYSICFICCLIPNFNLCIGIGSAIILSIIYIIKIISFIYNNLDGIYQKIVLFLNKDLDKSKIKITNEKKFKLLKKVLIESKYFENEDQIELAINSYMIANLLIEKENNRN